MNTLGQEGAGVRITGFVERVFVPPSGKCAFLEVSFPGEKPGKRQKVELVAFGEAIDPVRALGKGEKVQVTAGLSSKVLSNKARAEVEVDGRKVWMLQLVVRTVKTEGGEEKAPDAPPAEKKSTNWESEDKKNGIDW